MQNLSLQSMREGAFRLLLLQLLVALVIVIAVACIFGVLAAYSTLIGGVVCVFANLFFVKQFFKFSGARSGKKIVMAMYLAEIFKLAITAFFFVIAITYWHVQPLPFLIAYFIVQSVSWFSPLIFRVRRLAIS